MAATRVSSDAGPPLARDTAAVGGPWGWDAEALLARLPGVRIHRMTSSRVAAVVPVYNRPTTVLEALASVAAQTRKPDRLIIVDDGSTDETATSVQRWLEQNPRAATLCSLIHQANAGPASARNHGAAEARDCDALAFLDSDDLWPADYLARMTQALGACPEAVAASCDLLRVDRRAGMQALQSPQALSQHTTLRMFLSGPPQTSATVLRSQAFHALRGYEAGRWYGEDYMLMLRMSLRGRWLYVPGRPVTYRGDESELRREAPGLATRFADRRSQRVELLQRFIFEEGGRHALPRSKWTRRLAWLWYKAGRGFDQLGRSDQAYPCYCRALQLRPLMINAAARAAGHRWRLLRWLR